MARVQRVIFPMNRSPTPSSVPITCRSHRPRSIWGFLRDSAASPHTIRGYAAGLARWFTVLEHTGHPWDDFPTTLFGQYLQYLRTGARTVWESITTATGSGQYPAASRTARGSASRIRVSTPARRQRLKNPYTVRQGGKSTGRARHLHPLSTK